MVIKNLCVPVLVGILIQGCYDLILKTADRSLTIGDTTDQGSSASTSGGQGTGLRLKHDVTIKPHHQQTVACTFPIEKFKPKIIFTKAWVVDEGVAVANAVSEIREEGTAYCMLANTSKR